VIRVGDERATTIKSRWETIRHRRFDLAIRVGGCVDAQEECEFGGVEGFRGGE